jgi:hypothetical protein
MHRYGKVLRRLFTALLAVTLGGPFVAVIDRSGTATALGLTAVALTLQSETNPSDWQNPVSMDYTIAPVPHGGTLWIEDVAAGTTGDPQPSAGEGSGILSWRPSAKGNRQVRVCFSGDQSLLPGCSPAIVQTVWPVPTNVTLTVDPTSLYRDESLTFRVHVSPPPGETGIDARICDDGLPLWFVAIDEASGDGTLTLDQPTVERDLAPGLHQFTACYPGNRRTQPGTSPAMPTLIRLDPSTVTVAADHANVRVGEAITFTVTVSPAPPPGLLAGLWVQSGSTATDVIVNHDGSGTGSVIVDTTGWPSGDAFADARYGGTIRIASSQARANFAITSDSAPKIEASTSSVVIDERQVATLGGTYDDVDGDLVSLSVDFGSIQKTSGTSSGSWVWNAIANGPLSRDVTVTASDGTTSATDSFQLLVNNAPPEVRVSGPANVPQDVAASVRFDYSIQDVPGDLTTITEQRCGSGVMAGGGAGYILCRFPTPGATSVVIVAKDADGGVGQGEASVVVSSVTPPVPAPDTVAPTVTTPTKAVVVGQNVAGGPPVRFAWSGADYGSGVDHFELALSTDGAGYRTLDALVTSSEFSRALAVGHTYRAAVRAVDKAGNVGSWVSGTSFRLTGYQEASRSIRWSGAWHTASSTSYWGGRERYTSATGATAKLTFTGRSIAWVGSVGPTRGRAAIYINGHLVKSISLTASRSASRRILFAMSWATSASRTLAVRISSASGHSRGDIDAFVAGS